MAYSQHEILVTGLKNAYALEAHAADVTENQASRLGDYPECGPRPMGWLPEATARGSIESSSLGEICLAE